LSATCASDDKRAAAAMRATKGTKSARNGCDDNSALAKSCVAFS
jgi:hypothetical protein